MKPVHRNQYIEEARDLDPEEMTRLRLEEEHEMHEEAKKKLEEAESEINELVENILRSSGKF